MNEPRPRTYIKLQSTLQDSQVKKFGDFRQRSRLTDHPPCRGVCWELPCRSPRAGWARGRQRLPSTGRVPSRVAGRTRRTGARSRCSPPDRRPPVASWQFCPLDHASRADTPRISVHSQLACLRSTAWTSRLRSLRRLRRARRRGELQPNPARSAAVDFGPAAADQTEASERLARRPVADPRSRSTAAVASPADGRACLSAPGAVLALLVPGPHMRLSCRCVPRGLWPIPRSARRFFARSACRAT